MAELPPFVEAKLAFMIIREYAAHSYIYYEKNTSLISDADYDQLCKWLCDNYSWMKPYDTNGYLDKDLLKCGSGYNISVCGLTRDYAELLLQDQPVKKRKKK